MKKLSVKLKITLWLTLMMTFLSGLLLAFMFSMSSTIVTQTSMSQLSQTLRVNLSLISSSDGQLQLDDGFQFYQNGISSLVYSKNGTLIAGQIPVSFKSDEPFENGVTRTALSDDNKYLLLDFWVPFGWDDGVWLRGLMEAPQQLQTANNLLRAALLALPAFLLIAALGGYRIVRHAFRPLDKITATADTINQAHDLSGRIGLPPGKDEFSRLAETFDQMFARLEQSFEAEKQFIADASHELRTPVSIIRGACEYAETYEETPEERQETISMIRRQSEKMTELISQLLNMTRLDQKTAPVQFENINLIELAEAICQDRILENKRLTYTLQQDISIKGDSILLTRLIQNLLDNAFKYGKPDGQVHLSLSRDEKETLLSVRDDGIGIPEDQQEKIWQRFYQIDPSRGENSGSGLGLSMVQRIAQVHGGYMTLKSIPNIGSDFTFHLPEKKP